MGDFWTVCWRYTLVASKYFFSYWCRIILTIDNTRSKTFPCGSCAAVFSDKSSQFRHRRETHRGKKHHCPLCKSKFDPFIYPSKLCLTCFFVRITRRSAFMRHVRDRHPEIEGICTPQYLLSLQREEVVVEEEVEIENPTLVPDDVYPAFRSNIIFLGFLWRRSDLIFSRAWRSVWRDDARWVSSLAQFDGILESTLRRWNLRSVVWMLCDWRRFLDANSLDEPHEMYTGFLSPLDYGPIVEENQYFDHDEYRYCW